MSDKKFGENLPKNNPLQVALETYPAMCSTNSQIILREAYETTYGIFNHDAPQATKRPLALVAFQWAEDASAGCRLYERMEQYHECSILKWFGMPWDRWIDQPHDVCEEQLRKGKKWDEADATKQAELGRQLEALKASMGIKG